MRTHRRIQTANRCAFSLMEIIIATAVLAASGAALFGLLGQAATLSLKAQQRSDALLIASALMEETKATGKHLKETESNGVYSSNPAWRYTVRCQKIRTPVGSVGSISTTARSTDVSSAASQGRIESDGLSNLWRVSITIYPNTSRTASTSTVGSGGGGPVPTNSVLLTGWVRSSARKSSQNLDAKSESQSPNSPEGLSQ